MKTLLCFLLSTFCFPLLCSAQSGVSHTHTNLSTLARLRSGTGSPEGVVTAAVGSVYLRTDGGVGTIVYAKESGSGNTGWAAVAGTTPSGSITASGYTMSTDRLLGRTTASTGAIEELDAAGARNFMGLGALATVTPGTGVATALAVNVGSAGAPVLFDGAGGTPTSIVLTNASGTAASLTAGTVTTNANLTGHVTSVGNAAVLGSFTLAQLNTAVSDADLLPLSGGTLTGTLLGQAGGATSLSFSVNALHYGIHGGLSNALVFAANGSNQALFYSGGLQFAPATILAWGASLNGANSLILSMEAAAVLQSGVDVNGDAVDQTFKSADGITGTDKSGADLAIKSGLGTGAGAVSAVIFSTPTVLGSGTTAQSYTERMRINSSGLIIGSGGSAISKVLTAESSLDFDLTALMVEDKTMACTGAAVGDRVMLAYPSSAVTATVQYTAWVSAADEITVRARTAAVGEDPTDSSFSVTVIKH